MTRMLGTLALRLLVAVGVALALSWVAAQSPVLSAVLTALAIAGFGLALARAVRAPRPRVAFGLLGAFALVGVGSGIAVGALVDGDADPGAVLPIAGERIEDGAGDCDRCGDDDLLALTTAVSSDATELRIELAGDPTAATFRLWTAARPTTPVEVAFDGRWLVSVPPDVALDPAGVVAAHDADSLTLRLPLALDGLAVTTDGGDRVPDVGGVDAPPGEGTVLETVARDVAEVQAGWGRLDDAQRVLAAGLVQSQLASWTLTYAMASDANPDLDLQTRIAADAGTIAQQIAIVLEDGSLQPAQTLLILDDGVQVCTHPPAVEVVTCEDGDLASMPTSAAAVMVRDPSAVSVVEVAPRDVDGDQRCLLVETSPDGGPGTGERCQSEDGAMGYRDNPVTGQRFVLTGRADVDLDLFAVPGA